MPRKAAILERNTWLAFLHAPYPAGHPPAEEKERSIVSAVPDLTFRQKLFAYAGGVAAITDGCKAELAVACEILNQPGWNTG